MACCGRANQSANTEYLVTLANGSQMRVPSIPQARIEIAKAGGGTYQAVAKAK